MMEQLSLTLTDSKFSGQNLRLYEALARGEKITAEDCKRLGISGSGLSRRAKDLRDIFKLPVKIQTVEYVRTFDNKKVHISQYSF